VTISTPAPHALPPSDPEPPACPPAPRAGCLAATRSGLAVVRGKREAKDALHWTWQGADAVDPASLTGGAGATLCLWDGGGSLVLSTRAPVSGTCGSDACWTATAKRARYADRKNGRTGTRAVTVASVKKGTRAAVVAGGSRLGRPALPVADGPVDVQLLAGDGTCLGTTYESLKRNDERRLKAARRR
jgi:hypothetical protein